MPEKVLVGIILRGLIRFLGDFVEIVARGDGGRERAAIEHRDALVASPGKLESDRAAPSASANDQNVTVCSRSHIDEAETVCTASASWWVLQANPPSPSGA